LESLGYVLVYLAKGKLPWQVSDKKSDKLTKIRQITEIKTTTTTQDLCENLPPIFAKFFSYISVLRYG
jgi:hypothetical protein